MGGCTLGNNNRLGIGSEVCYINITVEEDKYTISEPRIFKMTEYHNDRFSNGTNRYADIRTIDMFVLHNSSAFYAGADGCCLNNPEAIKALKKKAVEFVEETYDEFIRRSKSVISLANKQKKVLRSENLYEINVDGKRMFIDLEKAKELGVIQ